MIASLGSPPLPLIRFLRFATGKHLRYNAISTLEATSASHELQKHFFLISMCFIQCIEWLFRAANDIEDSNSGYFLFVFFGVSQNYSSALIPLIEPEKRHGHKYQTTFSLFPFVSFDVLNNFFVQTMALRIQTPNILFTFISQYLTKLFLRVDFFN